jgi:hypothetical protein
MTDLPSLTVDSSTSVLESWLSSSAMKASQAPELLSTALPLSLRKSTTGQGDSPAASSSALTSLAVDSLPLLLLLLLLLLSPLPTVVHSVQVLQKRIYKSVLAGNTVLAAVHSAAARTELLRATTTNTRKLGLQNMYTCCAV